MNKEVESPIWKGLRGAPEPGQSEDDASEPATVPTVDRAPFVIKKGISIPPPRVIGKRGPITMAFAEMAIGDCMEMPPQSPKVRSDLYVRAKTAKIRITMRTVKDNGVDVLRIWRTA